MYSVNPFEKYYLDLVESSWLSVKDCTLILVKTSLIIIGARICTSAEITWSRSLQNLSNNFCIITFEADTPDSENTLSNVVFDIVSSPNSLYARRTTDSRDISNYETNKSSFIFHLLHYLWLVFVLLAVSSWWVFQLMLKIFFIQQYNSSLLHVTFIISRVSLYRTLLFLE